MQVTSTQRVVYDRSSPLACFPLRIHVPRSLDRHKGSLVLDTGRAKCPMAIFVARDKFLFVFLTFLLSDCERDMKAHL